MESSDSVVDYKLSWAELKDVVNNLRKQLSSLSTMVPSSVTFRKLQDGRTRIYFLSAPQNGWETTLLFVDVPTDAVSGTTCGSDSDTRLQWHCVIESNFPTISSNKFSREEQLLWERKRLATWGINSYELHDVSGKIIFPASSSLFQCIDSGYSTGALFPTKLRMNSSGAKLNPQICPTNSDLVAYICNHDIWVSHTVSGCNVRLTYAHKGGRSLADDPLCAGVPSYVMQEEFSRYQGYWWQPNSIGGIYRLLYEEVDDGDVKIFCFPSSQTSDSNTTPSTSNLSHLGGNNISVGITGEMGTPNSVLGLTSQHSSNPGVVSVGGVASGVGCGDVEEFRFPRAGCANSKSYLKLIEFRVSDTRQVVDVVMLELQFSLSVLFPWMEYIVRADWTPDGEYIWVQLLDRRQQRLDLVLLSLNNFTEVLPMYDDSSSPDLSNPLVQVIYSEESCVWINVHDLLCFLPSPDENEVQFIWASEETGFRHLYHVTSQILPYPNAVNGISEQVEYVSLQPKITRKVALTSGDWEVVGQDIWLDYERQLVYFMGLRETVLEKHLYVVSLRRPGEIRLLTTPGYSFVIDFNTECTMFLAVYSNVTQVPTSEIFRVTHTDWTTEGVTLTSLGHLHQPHTNPSSTTTPYHSNTTAYHSNPTNTPYNPNNTTSYHPNATTTSYHQNTTTPYHPNATTTNYHQNTTTTTSFNPNTTTTPYQSNNSTTTSYPQSCSNQASSINNSTSCSSSVSGGSFCCNNSNLGYAPPDLYTYTITSGTVLHAMVFKPHGYRPNTNNSNNSCRRRYPTVLNVYGGPEVQLVSNTFKGMRQLRLHMLAARGYCVVAIDSRGSQHRGLKFESHLRCKMGTVELADQVEVLHYLADTLGFIDLARVAIHGWSYGGYLSLMGLVQQPDVFKVAIAGAPVTNWALYDTGYTERYMDLPEQNEQGYTEGSVLNYINKFPEDENRLLIIHGLIDENVHFYHTSQLVSAMVKAGKPYQLQIYPNERHSLRHLDASKHYETTLLAFLQNHL